MAPEKSFAGPLQSYTAAIIAIKQEEAKKELERRMRSDEMSRIRQAIITALARHDAEFRTLIEERVGQAFSHALEKGIKPEEIEDYCGRVIFKVKESHYFEALYPKFTPVYTSGDEVKATIDELWKLNPADYLATFTQELTKKFSDYEVSYLNKLEALAQASLGQERRLREIEEEKNQRVAAAELDAHATDMSVEVSGVKALKKAYEVDMDETFDNAMKILSAFMANKQKCIEKTNVKKWFSFDASSAAKALAKVKSDDNAFAPVGIVWKEIDKL